MLKLFSTPTWISSDISKIFRKASTKFHNLSKFLVNFHKYFQNFYEVFSHIALIFLQNVNKYYSKLILFSNFHSFFSTIPQSLIEILSNFVKIFRIFFERFTRSHNKVTVEGFQIFILVYLKIFLQVSKVFLNFFLTLWLFFSKN